MNKKFEDGHQHWVFKDLIGHRKVQYKETKYWEGQVQVLWDNDEKTWEPMHVIRKDDPLSLVRFAHYKLTKANGWKWTKKYKNLIHRYVKLITRVNALQAQKEKSRNKYKFAI